MRQGFAEGVTLADGTALSPAEVSALSEDGLVVRVVLKQGVYHQIKRMFAAVGKTVLYLKRLRMGSLVLDPALQAGESRLLSQKEIDDLRKGAAHE